MKTLACVRCSGEGAAAVAGIFTRQDVVGRVVLPGVGLEEPVGTVMTSPVLTASADETVADAMLRMAERTIRHLPVVRDSELIGVVTERDLFALQRRSLRQIGDSIRVARTTQTLRQAADDIREWSLSLVAQGVSPEFVTGLISRLNGPGARHRPGDLVLARAGQRGAARADDRHRSGQWADRRADVPYPDRATAHVCASGQPGAR